MSRATGGRVGAVAGVDGVVGVVGVAGVAGVTSGSNAPTGSCGAYVAIFYAFVIYFGSNIRSLFGKMKYG